MTDRKNMQAEGDKNRVAGAARSSRARFARPSAMLPITAAST